MATKAEIALATANSFLQEAGTDVDRYRGDEEKFPALRNTFLNTIALASNKIIEAEKLDPNATYTQKVGDATVTLSIPQYKAMALEMEGTVYFFAGEDKKAIATYDKAIAIFPDFAKAWYGKGRAHIVLKNKAEAIAALEKAIEVDPEDIDYHKALERAKAISGSEIAFDRTASAVRKTGNAISTFFTLCALGCLAISLFGAYGLFTQPNKFDAFMVTIMGPLIYTFFVFPFQWIISKFRGE